MSRRELVLIFLLGFCVGMLLPSPRCHADKPTLTITHAKWQEIVLKLARYRARVKGLKAEAEKLQASLKAAKATRQAERAAYEKRIAALRVLTSKVRKPPKCPRPVAEWIAISALGLLVVGGTVGFVVVVRQFRP